MFQIFALNLRRILCEKVIINIFINFKNFKLWTKKNQ